MGRDNGNNESRISPWSTKVAKIILIQGGEERNCSNNSASFNNHSYFNSSDDTERTSISSDGSQLLPLVPLGGLNWETSASHDGTWLLESGDQQRLSEPSASDQGMGNGGGARPSSICHPNAGNATATGYESVRCRRGSWTRTGASTPTSVAEGANFCPTTRSHEAAETEQPSRGTEEQDRGLLESRPETGDRQSSPAAEGDSNNRPRTRDDNGGCKFKCSICFETPWEPVVTVCGHLYCWQCLRAWMAVGTARCPVCKAGVSEKNVIPVYGSDEAVNSPTESSSCSAGDNVAANSNDISGIRRRANVARSFPSSVHPDAPGASPERPRAERPPASSSSSSVTGNRTSSTTASPWSTTLHGIHFGFSPFGLGIHFDGPFRPPSDIPLTREQRSHLVSAVLIIFGISILFWAVFAGANTVGDYGGSNQHVV